jgi:translation initiation factor IF-3
VDLDEELEDFKKSVDKMSLKLADGKKVKYTPEIKRRTLMTFAEAHKTVNKLLTSVREASTMEELLKVFFSSAIDEMHAEVTE